MRNLLITFLLCFASVFAYSQTQFAFRGKANIYSATRGVGVDSAKWTILAVFQDDMSYYLSDSTDVGDYIYTTAPFGCAALRIDVVNAKTGGILNLQVTDMNNKLTSVSGVSAVFTKTTSKGLPLGVQGLSAQLQACILTDLASRVDAAIAAIPVINNLTDLNDVTITSPQNNQFLMYRGSQWINLRYPVFADTSRTLVGYGAGAASTSANTGFTFFGYNAGTLMSGGTDAIGIGRNALGNTVNGGSIAQIAIGPNALGVGVNTAANGNLAIGVNSGRSITSGSYNVFLGNNTGFSTTTGQQNTIVGDQAGNAITGSRNTFIGYQAGRFIANIGSVTAVGGNAASISGVSYVAGSTILGTDGASLASGTFNGAVGGLSTLEGGTSATFFAGFGNYIGRNGGLMDFATIFGDRAGGSTVFRMSRRDYTGALLGGYLSGARSTVSGVFLGRGAGTDSKCTNCTVVGNQATNASSVEAANLANGLRGDNMVIVGNSSTNVPFDDPNAKVASTAAAYNTTTDRITLTAHGFGTNTHSVQLRVNCTVCPTGFTSGQAYMFEIIDANTIFSNTDFTTAPADGNNVTFTPRTITDNSTTVGNGLTPVANQAQVWTAGTTEFRSRNYIFDVDQVLTGLNGNPMVYNETTNQMQVSATGSKGSTAINVTQTAHGFTAGTPVLWDGFKYKAVAGVTGDTIRCIGLVVAVTDVNNFELWMGGVYNNTFGRTQGLYYANTTGGASLTPDPDATIKILRVANGKTFINPIEEDYIQDISGTIFTLESANPGSPRNFEALQTLTLHGDSIMFTANINGISCNSVGDALRAMANTVSTSSAGSVAMSTAFKTYIFTGTTSTYTLPAVSGSSGVRYIIKNAGSGALTLNTTAAANEIYDTALTNSVVLAASESITLFSNGTAYYVIE